ncbi:hypothetical protein [Piscirickettsia litoralis]|uniref:GGDEF domain-containing protein n=1 Tax=Piscirickettsia litoralis TaxID=1891921 RepID=A0ABX3A2G2_9GAMM|nr:hypothetical protein [Piscirickettsia litoralis]ODN43069.1 hypothetical protein BGC07_09270 [Piscirickettsia litoralis]
MYEIQQRTHKGWENAWVNHSKLARHYDSSQSAFSALQKLITEQSYAVLLGDIDGFYAEDYRVSPEFSS